MFIVFLLYCMHVMTVSLYSANDTIAISLFTEQFHHRIYLIKRLQPIIDLLEHKSITFTITDQEKLSFSNPWTLRAIERWNNSQNFRTFKRDEWQNFVAYKFIKDPSFSHEFILLLTLILKQYITNLKSTTKIDQLIISELTQELLHDLSENNLFLYIEKLRQHIPNSNSQIFASAYIAPNNRISGYTELLTLRYYYIQRLSPTIIALSKIGEPYQLIELFRQIIHRYRPKFTSDIIKITIDLLIKNNSIKPLFYGWHELIEYKYIDNHTILKEYIMLLVLFFDTINNMPSKNINDDLFGDSCSPEDYLNILDTLRETHKDIVPPFKHFFSSALIVVKYFLGLLVHVWNRPDEKCVN